MDLGDRCTIISLHLLTYLQFPGNTFHTLLGCLHAESTHVLPKLRLAFMPPFRLQSRMYDCADVEYSLSLIGLHITNMQLAKINILFYGLKLNTNVYHTKYPYK